MNIINTTCLLNTALFNGGGMYIAESFYLNISNLIILKNIAEDNGGGLYIS